VPFVLLQILMVTLVIAFPGIVGGGSARKPPVNVEQIDIAIPSATSPDGGSAEESLEDALSRALGGGDTGSPPKR
jgi:hypothetical protein